MYIDHIDIVTTHRCNQNCEYCIDPLRNSSNASITSFMVNRFLCKIKKVVQKPVTVLLLGGEPTVLGKNRLKMISDAIHLNGFRASISTNGKAYKVVKKIEPYFDSIQITIDDFDQIYLFEDIKDKVNIKMPGDAYMNWNRLSEFMDLTSDFYRQSVPMYFNPHNFEELCKDKYVWDFLDSLDWNRNGSYDYAFFNDVRFKKCIPGQTNIIDEPMIPKLYPNGNYNCNWRDENMDNYLKLEGYK